VRIAESIGGDTGNASRAAELSKCDLLTLMVGEFPELQGLMGKYYAQHDGEQPEVCAALEEQYWPRFAGDRIPETRTGIALALADKLDTLAGIFAIGQKPSGTKDPFGLRRAAIGVLRILLEKKLDLDLRALIARAGELQPVKADTQEIWDYVLERLRAYLLDAGSAAAVPGATTERIDAVRASAPASPLDFTARLAALVEFLERPEAASLTAANKRIANILKKAEGGASGMVDATLLGEPAEKALCAAIDELTADVGDAVKRREYRKALSRLATLRPAVDTFFDDVMVNAEDPALRRNRLALLAQLRGLFTRIADLSCLPG
jgi:glycyl-tRNA synthetase beta chain